MLSSPHAYGCAHRMHGGICDCLESDSYSPGLDYPEPVNYARGIDYSAIADYCCGTDDEPDPDMVAWFRQRGIAVWDRQWPEP